jgi:glycosyltransferase involved in cell wall biosynthesis
MIPNNIFTIIIPCKNEDAYIYNTLYSLSIQNFIFSLNVIIADASSTDLTLCEIDRAIRDFPNLNISIINGGSVSVGRNNGAKFATTPYLIFLDADAILTEEDILYETYMNIHKYELITTKHKSTTYDVRDILIWNMFNIFRFFMRESFSTGCYFVISSAKFNELGGFDESVNNSEDYLLSRKIPKIKFKILNRYVGQDNRRFRKMGYFGFIKLILHNYINRNNIEYFKKDAGYWA